LDQPISIDEKNTLSQIFILASSLNFYSNIETVGVTGLGDLWALRWAWHGKLFLGQSIGIVESIGIDSVTIFIQASKL